MPDSYDSSHSNLVDCYNRAFKQCVFRIFQGWPLANSIQFNYSIQKIICIALPYRISITGGPAQLTVLYLFRKSGKICFFE